MNTAIFQRPIATPDFPDPAEARRFIYDPDGWYGYDPERLKLMLAPYPSEEMTCWPVSPRVSNIKNNDPSLIEPIATAG